MNTAARPHRLRPKQRGVALIEALVAILIFAFGIVGMVGLQASMTRAQGNAKYRADAAYLGSQLLGQIWADRANLAQYDTGGGCAGHAPCADWAGKVAATLPLGSAEISATPASGVVSLTLTWSAGTQGTSTHVVTTSIR